MAEIIAKIGLDHARFDRGLSEASRGWEAWAQKVRRTPIEFVPAKSARDSARVFEDIERARAEHIGNLNRDRLERALATGAGAIGNRSGKSAAESASAFSALLPPLPEVEKRANGILGLLRKKFTADATLKDTYKTFGLALGVGAIAQGFRATIDAAQSARDKAAELGRTVDEGTAAVARYGDAWDRIKRTVAETAISGLGLVVRSGEAIGELLNDQVASRFRGMTPEQARRTREISEGAAATADRLSSPQAIEAARARGEARRVADEQKMREVARLMNDGAERREESALREKPLVEQITILEQRRNALLREYNDSRRSVLERAKAFAEAAKTEEKIAERRRDLDKQTTAEQERQARARQDQLEQEQRALEKRIAAEERVRNARDGSEAARGDLSQAKRDALAFGVGEAAAGLRGNSSDRLKARAIQRDEARARRLFDSGATVTEFDATTQRNVQRDATFFQNRALSMRENFKKLDSSEQKPFASLEKRIEEANKHLAAVEKALTPTKTNSGGAK